MKGLKQIVFFAKKRQATVAVCILAILAAVQNLTAETAAWNNADYFIRVYGEEYKNLSRDEAMRLLRMDANSLSNIEAVGWSPDGLFAYRYRYRIDNGMISCWVYSLAVINAVTDQIIKKSTVAITELFNKEFPGDEELEYVADISRNWGIKIFFREIREEPTREYANRWNAILAKHNISGRVDDPFSETFRQDLLQFPIDGFYARLEHNITTVMQWQEGTKRETEADIVSWKLLIGNERVQKVIAEGEDEEQRFIDNVSGRKILGYYKSPYQNRIVAVVSRSRFVPISGGNHSVSLDVFGCNMNVGLSY